MHYKDGNDNTDLEELSRFLEEMGLEKNGKEEKFKLTSKSDAPEETQVVVLIPQH